MGSVIRGQPVLPWMGAEAEREAEALDKLSRFYLNYCNVLWLARNQTLPGMSQWFAPNVHFHYSCCNVQCGAFEVIEAGIDET